MSKLKQNATPEPLPPLPARRRRRRSVRPSHSWCWRKPPSQRRIEVAWGRFQPDHAMVPDIAPTTEAHH
ncbi:MAG TPA: hypothetical protein VGM59_07545 [Dongiaceae bacterium]|jgi:hypothetical protein